MAKDNTITRCASCGEILQRFEVMNDGTCPVCREPVAQDYQPELFVRPEQVFINFDKLHTVSPDFNSNVDYYDRYTNDTQNICLLAT